MRLLNSYRACNIMHLYIRFSLTGPLTIHVGSCQLNSPLIKSKFVSEFVDTDKPTKFVSCRFVSSCQLNSRLIKSKFVSEFVGTDKPTKFISCRFVSSCQLNPSLVKSKKLSVNLSVLTNREKFCICLPK